MSVNGSGLDRRTNKPLNDQTHWVVREPHSSKPVTYRNSKKEWKEAKGLSATEAFALVRTLNRREGEPFVVAVRS